MDAADEHSEGEKLVPDRGIPRTGVAVDYRGIKWAIWLKIRIFEYMPLVGPFVRELGYPALQSLIKLISFIAEPFNLHDSWTFLVLKACGCVL